MVVKSTLDKLGLHCLRVDLGEVEIKENLTEEQLIQLKIALSDSGFELMEDKKAILIEQIKNVIIEMVHYDDELPKVSHSTYISEKLNQDYTYISNLFSELKGVTIEHFIIAHKIERVKELLIYEDLNLTEISYRLNYSSVAHLSSQFKKVTGLTPTNFKKLRQEKSRKCENV